jgi:hypothetical protein
LNNWTKIGCVFLVLGSIVFFSAIYGYINTFNFAIRNPNIGSSEAPSAAWSVSLPIVLLSALDYLVGIAGITGRPSSVRERLDRLGKTVNDNFSVTRRLLGIVGAMVAFLCIALPWWTYAESGSDFSMVFDARMTIYLYQATATWHGVFSILNMNIWYGSVALVLVLIGGVLGITGSLARGTHARNIVIAGGLLTILSAQVFMVGFQLELYNLPYAPWENGVPAAGWFWWGLAFPLDVICYLSIGFWFALIAGVMMLSRVHIPETDSKKPTLPSMKESCE